MTTPDAPTAMTLEEALMLAEFTPEERARVIELNDRLMQDATGAAVVIVGLESQLVDLRRRIAAFDENLEVANSPELLPCFNQRLYDEWKELVLDVRAALREAGADDA